LFRILKEPLVHFLFIGASLFFIYAQVNDTVSQSDNKVYISKNQLNKIYSKWVDKTGKAPNKLEKKRLLDEYIEQEVLFKEAMAKGLDKNDHVIRKHLAKKMKFVFDDNTVLQKPTNEELKNLYKKEISLFQSTQNISFNQIVFSKDTKNIEEEAKKLLKRLKSSKSSKVSTIGKKVDLNKISVEKIFSKKFSNTIFNLELNRWQGPFKTKYGLHLVNIHSIIKTKAPSFEDMKNELEIKYTKQQLTQANKVFYKNLYKKYEIIIDE
jgi:parvulin-like peptidyl-prolyl isomerase